MRSSPAASVEARAADAGIVLDDRQRELVTALTRITRSSGSSRGLYIHGPAGRGKSWIANAFFDALPTKRKTRVHFHGFLDSLHRSIHRRRDEENAVERALDDIVGNSRVLFFVPSPLGTSRQHQSAFRRGRILSQSSSGSPGGFRSLLSRTRPRPRCSVSPRTRACAGTKR